MKKLFVLILVLAGLFCFSPFGNASEYADNTDVLKISMNGTVKRAKEIGSGNGIEFTLPDLNSNDFIINSIELAIFEKRQGENIWNIYTNEDGLETKKRLIENPASLHMQVDFSEVSDYRGGAKYKIAYRYYVQSTADMSKIVIAGQEIKDGWRIVGEVDEIIATDSGFMFYPNTSPALVVNSISYDAEDITGPITLTYSPEQLQNVWLCKDALSKGITVNLTATDDDTEDVLTVSYRLTNSIGKIVISEGILGDARTIKCNTEAEFVELSLTVSDNWGKAYECEGLILKIDNENPQVADAFNDMGRVLKGQNLYSKFTISDDQNDALTSGNVYYTISRGGTILYESIRLPNNENGYYIVDRTGIPDGEYEIKLSVFDKAYNKNIYYLNQTLDNTAPTVSFLAPNENSNATLYSTWMNGSKKIIFTAEDQIAGVKKYNGYLNYSFIRSSTLGSPQKEYTFSFDVVNNNTGKLYYYFYIYDNACTINKTTNTVNTSSSGNSIFVSRYVWLDKTAPTVALNADESLWYHAPATITMTANDYESSVGKGDNSGVKSKLYCITQTNTIVDNWLAYPSNGVTFNSGGVYYLHVKAIDYAGNETMVTKKIKVNTKSTAITKVTPTNEYLYTIYNQTTNGDNNVYVIKNTAYNTKFQYSLQDADSTDTIRTEAKLVSEDDSSVFASASVDTLPTGEVMRNIVFNMPYTKADGTPLPDGVYKMLLKISEVKDENEALITHQNITGCEVVIKRSSPPTPSIDVESDTGGKKVNITYPDETMSGSLNRTYIKAIYKREYKVVTDGSVQNSEYLPYTKTISPVIKDCVVTALYTDAAGNISTATKRVYADDTNDGDTNESILTDGNIVTIEEGRPANVYYIGTRRDKQGGVDGNVFKFLR